MQKVQGRAICVHTRPSSSFFIQFNFNSNKMLNPLVLPEIVHRLGRFIQLWCRIYDQQRNETLEFHPRDLIACLQVCRMWNSKLTHSSGPSTTTCPAPRNPATNCPRQQSPLEVHPFELVMAKGKTSFESDPCTKHVCLWGDASVVQGSPPYQIRPSQ